MKIKILLAFFYVAIVAFSSCTKSAVPEICGVTNPNQHDLTENNIRKGGGDKGGGKGKNNDNDGGSDTDPGTDNPFTNVYRLISVEDYDPLYEFAFNSAGTEVMFFTDSSITSWGTDYWGYWDEPYTFSDNKVSYTIGLSSTTYEFEDLGNDQFEVTKTLVTSQYLGTGSTTTVTTPGIYQKID